jgi:PAS domain S-box-containing protein
MTRKPARKRKTPTGGKAKGVRAATPEDRIPITREIFEQFMDHLPAATFIKDAEGRTLYFNRFMREVLGADESWIGRRPDEMWPGEVGETMRRDDDEARRKGFQEREEAVPGADGTARDYHTQKFVIPGKGGQPLLAGIALDISKRKAALRALETSEATLRAIFESAGDGIALVDPSTLRLVTVNQRYADMFGYGREEMLRLTITDVHPAEIRDQAISEFTAHVSGARIKTPEIACVRKDGSVLFASITSTTIRLSSGELQLGIFRDVTDQRDSEEALRQSEERFRVMFENAPFGVALVDADGRPVLANRAIEDMLGYSAERLKRMRFTDFTHPDDVRTDEDLFHQVMRGERESYRMVKRYIRRDGEIVWGNLAVVGIRDREGKLTHVMGMVEDISQRKRVERELKDI